MNPHQLLDTALTGDPIDALTTAIPNSPDSSSNNASSTSSPCAATEPTGPSSAAPSA